VAAGTAAVRDAVTSRSGGTGGDMVGDAATGDDTEGNAATGDDTVRGDTEGNAATGDDTVGDAGTGDDTVRGDMVGGAATGDDTVGGDTKSDPATGVAGAGAVLFCVGGDGVGRSRRGTGETVRSAVRTPSPAGWAARAADTDSDAVMGGCGAGAGDLEGGPAEDGAAEDGARDDGVRVGAVACVRTPARVGSCPSEALSAAIPRAMVPQTSKPPATSAGVGVCAVLDPDVPLPWRAPRLSSSAAGRRCGAGRWFPIPVLTRCG